MIDRTAPARVQRLIRWLEPFQRCFGHRAQRLALRTYVHGVFSDRDRKSMQAMLARVTTPISYQGLQHFITHAVWDADRISRRLLEVLPERHGVLIIAWWQWLAVGLVLVALEVSVASGFYILFFGVSAIVTSVLSLLGTAGPLWVQLLLFSVLSVLSLLFFAARSFAG